MRRREFITLLGGAAASWPQTATSQNTGRVHRVGVLFAGSERGSVPDEAFRSGLRERGYIEGKNIVIEFRTAGGKYDDLPGIETELVVQNVDVLFVPTELDLRVLMHDSRICAGEDVVI